MAKAITQIGKRAQPPIMAAYSDLKKIIKDEKSMENLEKNKNIVSELFEKLPAIENKQEFACEVDASHSEIGAVLDRSSNDIVIGRKGQEKWHKGVLQLQLSNTQVQDTHMNGTEVPAVHNGPELVNVSESINSVPDKSTKPTQNGCMELPERVAICNLGLGYIQTPEAGEVPTVYGLINGKPARILLDTGCGTNAISKGFLEKHRIEMRETMSIPLDLAETTDKEHRINQQTDQLQIELGEWSTEKAFYVIDNNNFDAILGIPFFQSYTPEFNWDRNTMRIEGYTIPLVFDDSIQSSDSMTLGVITRSRFKALVRQNEIESIYIGVLKDSDIVANDQKVKNESLQLPPWIMSDFSQVFPEELPHGLPPQRSVDHQIPLMPGSELSPPFRSIFRLSQMELQVLKLTLDKLLAEGRISPSTSPYGAPVLFVKKKDGGLRMCIDYRALNSQTIKNRYALPRIDELLDRLHGAKIFSKIDLISGYYQIAIDERDRHKTAFRTRYGHYQFNVMPFGLTNAPATFQTLMNDIFRDMLDECVIIYLDDILIFSKTKEQHENHLRKVLQRLEEHKLFGRLQKSVFFTTEIEYLGFIISPHGIQPNSELVRAIQLFPRPHSLKSLQSFLGLANYYRKFIENYSKIVVPLTNVMGNTSSIRPLKWTTEMQQAFNEVKLCLTSSPCLIIPDPDGEFEVTTDASDGEAKAIGAVLTQNGHPVAFESKKLDKHQLNYSVHDKEMCAIMHALERWRPFLLGKHFKIYTDHRSLTYFKTQTNLNQRQLRWQEKAADYDCEILYKPGKENKVADALSRIQISILCPIIQKSKQNAIRHGYKDDPLGEIIKTIHEGRASERFKLDKGLLYYQADEYSHWRLCIPRGKIRDTVLHDNHDARIAGHGGIAKTYSNIARAYYWQGMGQDIRHHVQTCDACQRTKASHLPEIGVLRSMPIPHRPWSSIGMDLVGPLPPSRNKNDMIFVVVDRLTKMAHFIPTTHKYTSKIIANLFITHVFRYHGLPDSIVSDRDPKFTSHFWKALQKELGVRLLMSTADHPQTDGQAEATVKIIQKMLKPFTIQGSDWEELLPSLEFAYNDTVQSSTKQTPFFLNYGQHPTGATRVDNSNVPSAENFVDYLLRLQEAARDAIQDAQLVQARYANQRRTIAPRLKVGDWVLLKRKKDDIKKLGPIADGPFKVLKVGTNSVKLDFPKNSRAHRTVNISRVQYYFGEPPNLLRDELPDNSGDPYYAVDKILAKKTEDGKTLYLIHWKGYPSDDDSWEKEENLTPDLVAAWNH